jgi:site-specific DNA recombinase
MDINKYRKVRSVELNQPQTKEVWLYTRVSSKGQYDNNGSIEEQVEINKRYALNNGYIIANTFGETYESASGDFTRKEFSRLMETVKKSRKRPFAILISKINRFSRSGGNAIGLVDELVKNIGVHLIETTSGMNTLTERGLIEVNYSLLKAKIDNMDRLDVTVPGLKRVLQKGKRIGKAPRGYDHYGPKVGDYRFIQKEQKLVINEEGKILAMAWDWKVDGLQDSEIIRKLEGLGVKMHKQALSRMWRNVFYCGYIDHGLLDELVPGTWETIVSKDIYAKVNELLNGKKRSGYKQIKETSHLPLKTILRCLQCDSKYTGYLAKKKYPYYKCQNIKCTGKDLSAETSHKSIGLHDLFLTALRGFKLDPATAALFKEHLLKNLASLERLQEVRNQNIKTELSLLMENQKKALAFLMSGTIANDQFKVLMDETLLKIKDYELELENSDLTISNSSKKVNSIADFIQNIDKIWHSATLSNQHRIQKLIFPEGLYVDHQNRQYRTKKMNEIFKQTLVLMGDERGIKKDSPVIFTDESCFVAREGLEPSTSAL